MLATIILIVSWVVNIVFCPESVGVFFTILPIPFSVIATYAAATDMDWSLFSRWGSDTVTVRTQYLGETSAVSIWSVVTVGFVALDVFVYFLVIEEVMENLWEILAFLLCILGGIFTIIGGFVAHREWEA